MREQSLAEDTILAILNVHTLCIKRADSRRTDEN